MRAVIVQNQGVFLICKMKMVERLFGTIGIGTKDSEFHLRKSCFQIIAKLLPFVRLSPNSGSSLVASSK
jgi:hypothetical protein